MNSEGQDKPHNTPSSSEVALGVRIDQICGEFEKLLKGGKSPKIESFLSQLPEDHQGTLLEELLGLELDYRAKAGDSFTSDEYTLRFPEHASTVADLVVSIRQRPDGKPRQAPPKRGGSGSSQTTERSHSGATRPMRIGPYEIIEPCGKGGMGVVYKAWHEFFKQYRAIKILPSNFDEDDISRFSMEIELAGRLNHPNIVRAHEANRERGILYLAMEFVDGINLDQLVKHHKRLPVGTACEMIRQAAEGLQHAHEHFLVHRDIKPSNLMVNQKGQVKILDFGLARLHAEQAASRLTKHGSVMGTLDFMAPEQWEDPMAATIQADIYSLGCTLYYLVTGTPPYGGENYSHWLKKQEAHRKFPVPKLDHEHGESLQPIIDRMMAKSKKDRFKTPSEIVEALEPLSDDSQLTRYAQTPVPKTPDSEIHHTPIPTVEVSNTEVLGKGVLDHLANQAALEDSEPNSKEKTLRPSTAKTDIDTDRPLPASLKTLWYKTRLAKVSLGIWAIVMLVAAWTVFRPPQNVGLAVQMGALPGLNGGLNNDWWFAEMPWYGPGVRLEFMKALRRGETQIAGISLEDWETRLADADTQSLQEDLKAIASELVTRLPDEEHSWADQMLLLNPGSDDYNTNLLKILPEAFRSESDLDESAFAGLSATQLHLVGNILHWTSTSNSAYADKAERVYLKVMETYDKDDSVERVLLAVARSDYSRLLSSQRDYLEAVHYANRAAHAVPEAALFQISLHCDLADQYRKLDGDIQKALAQISDGDDSARAWAEKMDLDENHPLQAEMLERRAWINVDGWQLKQAIQEFETATEIREANQKQGNTFAWRPILLNMQGQAMALHFLGQDNSQTDAEGNTVEGARKVYDRLIAIIKDPPQGAAYGTPAERQDRLPNVYERQGDAYLFGPDPDYGKAAECFDDAIDESIQQEFPNSATLWFHLTRMYYKHSLALALSNDFAKAEVKDQIEKSRTAAEDLEQKFQGQMSDDKAFQKQKAAYAKEQQVALAVLNLRQAEPDMDLVKTALKDLQQVVINDTERSQVSRTNIEVLLLVFKLLFDRAGQLDAEDAKTLGGRLITFTEAMREGDPAIRTQYLAPLFDIAIKAVPDPDRKSDLEAAIQK